MSSVKSSQTGFYLVDSALKVTVSWNDATLYKSSCVKEEE